MANLLKRTKKMKVPRVTVGSRVENGVRRWAMVMCENDHLQFFVPRGQWTDARKKYGGKRSTVDCVACAAH